MGYMSRCQSCFELLISRAPSIYNPLMLQDLGHFIACKNTSLNPNPHLSDLNFCTMMDI